MKAKWLITALAAAILAGGFITYQAYAAGDSPAAPPRAQMLRRLAAKLDLSTDQRTQIRAIIAADKDTLQSLLSQLHQARIDLRTAIRADNPTEANVRAASGQVAGVEADLAVERMKLFAKIKPVLTDVQRAKISEIEQGFDGLADSLIARIGND
jgi:Spy/CpxP family protein refolding chaperone